MKKMFFLIIVLMVLLSGCAAVSVRPQNAELPKTADLSQKDVPPASLPESTQNAQESVDFEANKGKEIGRVTIASAGVDGDILIYGDDSASLNKGVCISQNDGWWTPFSEDGRTLMAAHNHKNFKNLHEVKVGDIVHVELKSGEVIEFIVRQSRQIDSSEWQNEAYWKTPVGGLTVSTCYPKIPGTKGRWILNCERITDN